MVSIMKRTLTLIWAVLLCLAEARGDSVTVGLPFSNNNAFPFGGGVGGVATRYQQAYSASDFSGIGTSFTINSIDFLNGRGTLAPSTYTLYFSTITSGIDSLSNSDFDSNRGADNALFASATLSGAAPATLTFSGVPFAYNPASGNLLLDIVVSPGGVDANNGFGASYEANTNAPGVFSRYHNFGLGNIGWGLVTEFNYTPIPEPAIPTLIFLAVGLTAFLARARNVFPLR